jgi:c-di-GMP-binding flagellar brake protein YcgR
MFERTVTFWRRLLGRRPATASGATATAEEDRRSWHRIPADFATTLRPVGDDTKPLPAHITNISLGGVHLLTSRSFSEGGLVSIELPGASAAEHADVLACVIHANRRTDGRWSVGCTFSRELSNEDLAAFGARRQRPEPSDPRGWTRFPCDVTAACQVASRPDAVPFTARVLDIAAGGVGLGVAGEVAIGTLLSVELHAAHGDFRRTMLACVVHVTSQADHTWVLGCNFIRSLSEADLKALV